MGLLEFRPPVVFFVADRGALAVLGAGRVMRKMGRQRATCIRSIRHYASPVHQMRPLSGAGPVAQDPSPPNPAGDPRISGKLSGEFLGPLRVPVIPEQLHDLGRAALALVSVPGAGQPGGLILG